MNSDAKKNPSTRLKVTTGLRGGRLSCNHNRQLKVTAGLEAAR